MPPEKQATRPLIAVVGSADPTRSYTPALRDRDQAPQACRELGCALARAGCDLLVFSSKPGYVESDVALGYASASTMDDPGRIVARPSKNQAVKLDIPVDSPTKFEVEPDTSDEWELAYYQSLLRSDGVMLLGGGQSTRIAGIFAIVEGVPLLPVAAFAGGAGQVWVNLDKHRNDALDEDITLMGQPWVGDSADRLVASLLQQRNRRLKRHNLKRHATVRRQFNAALGVVWAALALCASLATIPFASDGGPADARALALLLTGPMTAAIAGALVRNSFGIKEQWAWAAVRGLGAGLVSVLLYVASQLLTLPTLLADFDARRLLFFVVPLGFTAGFTFDLVFEKLRSGETSMPSSASTLDLSRG